MKRRTMTLLLALCLVFTLLPFAASAEDSTAYVETEHFKVEFVFGNEPQIVYPDGLIGYEVTINITGKTATEDDVCLYVNWGFNSEAINCKVTQDLKVVEGEREYDTYTVTKNYLKSKNEESNYEIGVLELSEAPTGTYTFDSLKETATSSGTSTAEFPIITGAATDDVLMEFELDEDSYVIDADKGYPNVEVDITLKMSALSLYGIPDTDKYYALYVFKDDVRDRYDAFVFSVHQDEWSSSGKASVSNTLNLSHTGTTELVFLLKEYDTEYGFAFDTPEYPDDLDTSNVFTLTVAYYGVKYATGVDDDSVTGMPADTVVAGGGSVTPGNPSRENYVFKGWDSDDDGHVDHQPCAAIENISSDLTLTAVWALKEYTVRFDSAGGSDIAAQTVEHGKTVDKPADPTRAGYAFEGWYVGDAEYDFTQPVTSDLTLTAKWTEVHTVTLVYGNGDTETVPVKDGATYALPAASRPGYIFLGWKYGDKTCSAGDEFTVNGDMTFTAVWANMPDITPGAPDEPDEGLPFKDVREGQWFYEAVEYVYGAGIMDGTGSDIFAPNGTLTRAMAWTILARLDGVDTDGGATWYSIAQEWAIAKGISDGTEPMADITREQLVTMLYRFAEMNGADVTQGGMGIKEYKDYAEISDWALTAMVWAVNNGVIEGNAGLLRPTAACTRAEAAAILMRSCDNIL